MSKVMLNSSPISSSIVIGFTPLGKVSCFPIFDYITPGLRVYQNFVLGYFVWQFLPKSLLASIFSLNLAFVTVCNFYLLRPMNELVRREIWIFCKLL